MKSKWNVCGICFFDLAAHGWEAKNWDDTMDSVPVLTFRLPLTALTRNDPSSLIQILLPLLALKDQSTHAHVYRVYELTEEWLLDLNKRKVFTLNEMSSIALAALLHDIGKVGVLDEVLLKPASLTPSERAHLEQHSEIGYQLIRDFPGISDIALSVRHHHERHDGKGYPLGLKAKQIPLGSKVIAIVDAYDAITSDRPYRRARNSGEALKEIENAAGSQFCPELVSLFLQFMHARNQ